MKKKPYQTKEKTVSCVEEAAVAYGQQIINGNDSVSTECLSFDTATCKSNRLTVSEYFDEIRTALRKKYENKIDVMKRLLHCIFLLVILCPVKLQAQEGQPLDMLIASTADALVDSLYSFPDFRSNKVERGWLYDTKVYVMFDYGFSNKIVEYMAHKPDAVSAKKNGTALIYTYQENNKQLWQRTKKVRLQKEMTINIMERPSVKFIQDTVSIVIWSSYLQWGNYHKGEWNSNGWYIGKSDWIVCKYIYSKTEERWVLVESDFGGI